MDQETARTETVRASLGQLGPSSPTSPGPPTELTLRPAEGAPPIGPGSEARVGLPNRFVLSVAGYTVLAVAFFVALYFVDIQNTRDFLLAGSYWYVGQDPYQFLSIPPPINFAALTLPMFAVYVAAGNDLIVSVAFIKSIQLAASVAASLLVFKLATKRGASPTNARWAFLAFLFSPVLFYLNYIQVEQDILGIAISLLAFYVLLDSIEGRETSYAILLIGFLLLWYSVFLYYLPIVLAIVVLVYQKDLRRFFVALSALALALLFFLVPLTILHLWDFLGNISGTTSSGALVSVYSILNLLAPGFNGPYGPALSSVNFVLTLIWIGLVVAVPLLSRFLRFGPLVPTTALFAATFMLLQIYNGDEFVWVLPFATVLLATTLERHVLASLLLLQLYMLPVLLLSNMYAAPGAGAGTGVYYLGYLQFHQAVSIAPLIPNFKVLSKVLDVAAFVGLGSVFGLAYEFSRRSRPTHAHTAEAVDASATSRADDESAEPHRTFWGSGTGVPRWTLTRQARGWFGLWVAVGLLALFLGSTVSFPATTAASVSLSGSDQFPLGLFDSYSVMNGTLTYDTVQQGKAVYIAPSSQIFDYPVEFSRNISDENFQMNFSITGAGPTGANFEVPVLQVGDLRTLLSNSVVMAPNTTTVFPTVAQNTSLYTLNNPLVAELPALPTFFLTGASVLEYPIDLSGPTGQYYFLFHVTGDWYSENVIFLCQLGATSFELYVLQNGYYFGIRDSPNATWKLYPVDSHVPISDWNVAALDWAMGTLSFSLNNVTVGPATNFVPWPTNMTLYVGKLGAGGKENYRYALNGSVTTLLTSVTPYSGGSFLLQYSPMTIPLIDEGIRASAGPLRGTGIPGGPTHSQAREAGPQSSWSGRPVPTSAQLGHPGKSTVGGNASGGPPLSRAEIASPRSWPWVVWPYVVPSIEVEFDQDLITVQSNDRSVQAENASPTLAFGRLSNDSIALELSVSSLSIQLESAASFLPNIISLSLVTPAYLIGVTIFQRGFRDRSLALFRRTGR